MGTRRFKAPSSVFRREMELVWCEMEPRAWCLPCVVLGKRCWEPPGGAEPWGARRHPVGLCLGSAPTPRALHLAADPRQGSASPRAVLNPSPSPGKSPLSRGYNKYDQGFFFFLALSTCTRSRAFPGAGTGLGAEPQLGRGSAAPARERGHGMGLPKGASAQKSSEPFRKPFPWERGLYPGSGHHAGRRLPWS